MTLIGCWWLVNKACAYQRSILYTLKPFRFEIVVILVVIVFASQIFHKCKGFNSINPKQIDFDKVFI